MTLLTLRTQLRASVGNPSTADVTDANLNEDINAAYRDIVSKFRFHKARKLCTFVTVAGTQDYGLPTDCETVLRLRDETNGVKLRKIGDREFSERIPRSDSITDGPPVAYVRHRDYVSLITDSGGAPDDVYTIELFYKASATDMSGDSDSPVTPAAWNQGIRLLARWYYYDIRKGDQAKAATAFESYRAWLADKPSEIDEETVDIDSGVSLPTLKADSTRRRSSAVDVTTFEQDEDE